MIHELKTEQNYFESVTRGYKTFEARVDDRDFQVGDFLALNEIDKKENYTGRCCLVAVTYILRDYDLVMRDCVVMGIRPCSIMNGGHTTVYYWAEGADYSSDIRKLKSKLEYDKAILMDEQEKANKLEKVEREKRELEKLRLEVELSKSNVTINNTNHNEANATSTVSITIDQTIKAINEISPEVLSAYEKEKLEEKLSAIEVAKTSGNKEKLAGKVGNVLKYIADKGIEVGIAALPYLGEIAKLIQNLYAR